jgi:hypothetical protein
MSTGWSLLSLLRGHISYIKASKADVMPLRGQIILLSFFAVELSGRLYIFVLFCTPFLGLFDTNYHGYFGALSAGKGNENQTSLFDYHMNNTPIFFKEAWQQFKFDSHLYFYLPTFLYIFLIAMIISHIITGYIIQSKIHRKSKERDMKNLFHAFHSLMSPPLVLDWELIYRKSKGKITVKDSWLKSQYCIIYFAILHLIEHIVFCIPLIMLKSAITERNEKLHDLFPPLNDELYSTYVVNVLLGVGIVVAFILPPIQFGLAHLYFTKGHPWSRILNANTCSNEPLKTVVPQWDIPCN